MISGIPVGQDNKLTFKVLKDYNKEFWDHMPDNYKLHELTNHLQQLNKSCKILFAGGCHVSGYPVGEKSGFPKVALEFLRLNGLDGEAKTLGPLPLSHPERLVASCNAFNPNVLVLQIGNYETTPIPIRDYIRNSLQLLLPFQKRNESKKVTHNLSQQKSFSLLTASSTQVAKTNSDIKVFQELTNINTHFTNHGALAKQRLKTTKMVKFTLKRIIHTLLGKSMIDIASLQQKLDVFYETLLELSIPFVVVLSPLPSPDPVVMHYRRKYAYLLKEKTSKYGFYYLDILKIFESDNSTISRRYFNYFADPIHFNNVGHALLGKLVGQYLILALYDSDNNLSASLSQIIPNLF